MNLTDARIELADAVSAMAAEVTCLPRPVAGNLRVGDGWVTVGRRTPGQFLGSDLIVLHAFVCLGSDERKADELVDRWSGPLLDSVRDLYAGEKSVEPQEMVTITPVPGTVFVLALTATLELSE